MIDAFSATNRVRTFVFFGIAVGLAVGAALVGIEDNALGIGLAMLSAAGFVLGTVHPFRTATQFKRLTVLVAISLLALLVVGIPLSILGDTLTGMAGLASVLGFIGTALMLIASFVCIPACIVGVVGMLVTHARSRSAS